MPSITRRAVQGILVRFFRNGDEHHHGLKVAINEFELKEKLTLTHENQIKIKICVNNHASRISNKYN